MKKNEIIRELFDFIMKFGYEDNKQDSISIYTQDKMKNTIYVKKIDIKGILNVDSIAVTCLEKDFSDACDCDVRVAFNDTNIGKRPVMYINEVRQDIIESIYDYVCKQYSQFEKDMKAYNKVCEMYNRVFKQGALNIFFSEELKSLEYILDRFNKVVINKK